MSLANKDFISEVIRIKDGMDFKSAKMREDIIHSERITYQKRLSLCVIDG